MPIANVQFAQGASGTSGIQIRSSSGNYEGSLFARKLEEAFSAADDGRDPSRVDRHVNAGRAENAYQAGNGAGTGNSGRPEYADEARLNERQSAAEDADTGRTGGGKKAEAAASKADEEKVAEQQGAAAKSAEDTATANKKAAAKSEAKAEAARTAEKSAASAAVESKGGSGKAEKASLEEQSPKTVKNGQDAALEVAGKRVGKSIAENLKEKDGAETAKEAERLAAGEKAQQRDPQDKIDARGTTHDGNDDQREAAGAAVAATAGSHEASASAAKAVESDGIKIAPNPDGDAGNAHRGERAEHDAKAVTLEVTDYRNREAANRQPGDSSGRSNGENYSGNAGKGDTVMERSAGVDGEGDGAQIRLVRSWANGGELSEPAARGTRNGGFATYVRDAVNPQIIKQSGIILRNNNRGEIRLVLQPEHLGRVRLRIQLDDNRLSGRIFVDSTFVKESFEQNLSSLYRAFKDSGYETSEFEVLVDSGEQKNSAESSPEGTREGQRGRYVEAAVKTIQQLDDAVPILEQAGLSDLVNLVV